MYQSQAFDGVGMLGVLQEAISKLAQVARGAAGRTRVKADSDTPSVIRGAMSEYLESQRQFMRTAETCSHRGWPDRGAILYYTWKCQQLYVHRQELRFEHVFSRGEFETGVWSSLSNITDRLDKNWSDIDESGVLSNNPAYKDLTTEISEAEYSRGSMDKDVREGPIQTLQQHSEYRAARQAIYEKVREFDRRLGTLPAQRKISR
jgi:hypothetical protein